jgi:hypothetical protein
LPLPGPSLPLHFPGIFQEKNARSAARLVFPSCPLPVLKKTVRAGTGQEQRNRNATNYKGKRLATPKKKKKKLHYSR